MQKLQLSIPDPCHESWDNMTATNQGRFCTACAKTVIDFSEMSDDAVLAYFSKQKDEKVCGRLYPDQLNRVIQTPPTKTFAWRWNYILAFFMFLKAAPAKAQGRIAKKTPCTMPVSVPAQPLPGDTTGIRDIVVGKMIAAPNRDVEKPQSSIKLTGKIIDEQGNPVAMATVMLAPGNSGAVSDEQGNFTVKLQPAKQSLRISAIGYEAKTVTRFTGSEQTIILQKNTGQLGEVVVVANPQYRMLGAISGAVSIVRRNTLRDTLKNFFTLPPAIIIAPNPVQRGSTIHLETKLKKGIYQLQVIDATGRTMSVKEINVTGGKYSHQQKIEPTWSVGNYFIKISDRKGKGVMSTGFIVTD